MSYPDDPRLTAYALGELSTEARREYELEVARLDETARAEWTAEVAAIQQFAGQLASDLVGEIHEGVQPLELSAEQRAILTAAAGAPGNAVVEPIRDEHSSALLTSAQKRWVLIASTATAASLLIAIGWGMLPLNGRMRIAGSQATDATIIDRSEAHFGLDTPTARSSSEEMAEVDLTAEASSLGEGVPQTPQGVMGDVRIEFLEDLGVIIIEGSDDEVARAQQITDDIEALSDAPSPSENSTDQERRMEFARRIQEMRAQQPSGARVPDSGSLLLGGVRPLSSSEVEGDNQVVRHLRTLEDVQASESGSQSEQTASSEMATPQIVIGKEEALAGELAPQSSGSVAMNGQTDANLFSRENAPVFSSDLDFEFRQADLSKRLEDGAASEVEAKQTTQSGFDVAGPSNESLVRGKRLALVDDLASLGEATRYAIVEEEARGRFAFKRDETDFFGIDAERFDRFSESPGTESYAPVAENDFISVLQEPLSTFSIDVDTASYSNARRYLLEQHVAPPPAAVRIEEFINYFDYDYPEPEGEHPFAVAATIAECPWRPGHRLARIALQGARFDEEERPAANLVFLIDVSGSMQPENKLPLVQRSLRELAARLDGRDRVSIVVYAGSSGLVLDATRGDEQDAIMAAVDRLSAGGSTNGGEGIELAYRLARQYFLDGASNRVILCTDGDFNVGVTDREQLQRLIEEQVRSGIFLTVLGFGMGNLKDDTLEMLADRGNGAYAYIDSFAEARKLFVDDLAGTLHTIAKDVKIQVDFNPAQVAAYRLIGYENRALATEDFNNDAKDAGEIGAGHRVTALYEIVPAGAESLVGVTPSEYASDYAAPEPAVSEEAAASPNSFTVRLRYKLPEASESTLFKVPVVDAETSFSAADRDFQFASAAAAFGMLLRSSSHAGDASFDFVAETAQAALGDDESGRRAEFLDLVRAAAAIRRPR